MSSASNGGGGGSGTPVVRPAAFDEEVPAFDGVIKFISAHFLGMFKAASMVFGFGIFLVYFVQNGFYPDVDLWGFASLLIVSAFFGVVLTLYFAFGLSIPGFIWKEFHSDSSVMLELQPNLIDPVKKKDFYMGLISKCFFFPILLSSVLGWLSAVFLEVDYLPFIVFAILPLLSGLAVALWVWKKYGLSKMSSVKFFVFGSLSFSVAGIVSWVMALAIVRGGLLEQAGKWQDFHLFLSLSISVFLLFFMTVGLHMRKSYAAIIGAIVVVVAMLLTGMWSTAPGAIVRNLGIGNYVAESVLLKKDECERVQAAKYPVNDDCSLRDVYVVWAWAGSYQFKFSDGRRIRIEKDSIGPIVEQPRKAKGI